METTYNEIKRTNGKSIKMWTKGVPVEQEALNQLHNTIDLPIVFDHIAVMPDVHYGLGATVGSVVPTRKAIIPAAVGVDIGCGMIAQKTNYIASDLPTSLNKMRSDIEATIPHGGVGLKGGWANGIPDLVKDVWDNSLLVTFNKIVSKHPSIGTTNNLVHLGTLGTGNHFVEVCLDTEDNVWVMLHSGSRGVGNAIGRMFITKAAEEMKAKGIHLVDKDLAYLQEGSTLFNDYVEALNWAQEFAKWNREVMLEFALDAVERHVKKNLVLVDKAVNCHHNYVQREVHFGEEVYLTRKGAVSAYKGQLGIIPGSMGAKSYIVSGLGNPEAFMSCSHGAGRKMSRNVAKKTFTLEDHIKATEGVECRKDEGVIDETPACYKDIDAVMAAQADLVEIKTTLKQILCVKG